ncbi:uncharacterized protein LOC132204641 [Neocloeon triangulifer]|uniref:uncharacterized protein LOC132204641 n=1 Tax=Neocloeon triangulifer TaxID=2078957 RepID=UPI00286F02CE|nr:uncharacterized protein LOC132204641 [Neocloeon triangulifer]XP_059489257.1 uncharacterized protein LOC132204641 [Neocloeon triangulifer]
MSTTINNSRGRDGEGPQETFAIPQLPIQPPPPYFAVCNPLGSLAPVHQNRPSAPPSAPNGDRLWSHDGTHSPGQVNRIHSQDGIDYERDEGDRRTSILHLYTLVLVLLLATLTLVALSKLLPTSLANPLYNMHWLYYGSAAAIAASLIVLAAWQASPQSSPLNDCLMLVLWGSLTINLVLIGNNYTLISVYFAGCLTLVTSIALTLLALQIKTDLTKKSFELLVILSGVAAFVVALTVLRGGEEAAVAISATWIISAVLLMPYLTQFIAGGKQLSFPIEDFVLVGAILFTLIISFFQHTLLLFPN